MRYPYIRVDPFLPARPYVSLFLRSGYFTTNTSLGLLDSGADYSIFPVAFGEMLKVEWASGIPWNFKGTTGKLQMAYLHRVEMSVWDPEIQFVAFRFDTVVSFCPDFNFPGGALLGQDGFLSHFKTTLQQSENYFDLEPCKPEIAILKIAE